MSKFKKYVEELEFSLKIKSGDKTIDKIQGDWDKFEKGVQSWEEKIMGRKKKKDEF